MQRTRFLFILIMLGSSWGLAQDQENDLPYSMSTPWTDQVSSTQPWPEYPRPQLTRPDWVNLNGPWEYAIVDSGATAPSQMDGSILVPFAAESELSGVKRIVGTSRELIYRKRIRVDRASSNERWLLHFGAVDWQAAVFLNGVYLGTHRGGYTPFSFDVTPYLRGRTQTLEVRVWDPTDDGTQARGKQVNEPKGIWYTSVTGIWQTVWMEKVPQAHISGLTPLADIEQERLSLGVSVHGSVPGGKLRVRMMAEGELVAESSQPLALSSPTTQLIIQLDNARLWSPEDPFLYDLEVSLLDASDRVVDKVGSYAGMRETGLGTDANGYTCLTLNGAPYFQFGLLDQGWWPDGLYTAPNEAAMRFDLEVTKDLGFNMLRKHVKVEPARFYYLCDQMGILVWQDMPNGNYFQGLRVSHDAQEDAVRPLASARQFETELKEMIDYLYPFPSIVTWVPFNEGWGQYETERVTNWVKQYDPSRICDAVSGWADRGTGDMIDIHIYPGPGMEPPESTRASVIGEFGGLGWPAEGHLWWDKRNWGYRTFDSQEILNEQFFQLMEDLIPLRGFGLSGAIYTQTTDVEGEVNGLITYDRRVVKLDPEETRPVFQRLYQPAWQNRVVLQDAEFSPQSWKVAFDLEGDEWLEEGYQDQQWRTLNAPFTVEPNPFSPTGTDWDESKSLCLRNRFFLHSVPEQINMKFFIPHCDAELYINGQLVQAFSHQGGRKRHYSHRELSEALPHLQSGWNTIAIRATGVDGRSAVDFGLYTSKSVSLHSTTENK